MFNIESNVMAGVVSDLVKQRELNILKELDLLIKSGVLVVKESEPVLIRLPHENNLQYFSRVTIEVKGQEKIKELTEENQKLKEQLAKIKQSLELNSL